MIRSHRTIFIVLYILVGQLLPAQSTLFVPKSFIILDSASGDFNKDAYTDLLIILKYENEDAFSDSIRPLLLLAGTADDSYALMLRNDSVVLCAGCGGALGDPFQGITTKSGEFSIEYYGGSAWRWTRTTTFRYDASSSDHILQKDGGVSFHISDPDKQEDYLLNEEGWGKLSLRQYCHYKE